jgi:cell wall-associated NlpC family hydrolase
LLGVVVIRPLTAFRKGANTLLRHRFAVLTVSLSILLIMACIPPPAVSEPPATPSAQAAPPDPGQCVLDSFSLLTRALPVPQVSPAATTVIDSTVKAFGISIEVEPVEDEEPAADTETRPSNSGEALVGTARKYTGVRYRWAGMSSRGMDCSGFIARVLRSHNIRAPHNAAQLFQLGQHVAYEDLQPGDLLFFQTSRRGISHVGMYVGNNEFIHASSGAGRVVTTSLHDEYYAKRLKGARRLTKGSDRGLWDWE